MADTEAKTSEGMEQNETHLPTTQGELDALIQGRLDRERKKYPDYDALKKSATEYEKQKQAQMSEAEKKDARLKELETENTDLKSQLTDREAKVLRVQMLEAEGLPTSWAERVRGMTLEDIKADVAELKKLIGVKKPPVGSPAAPAESGGPPDMNTLIRGGLGF